MIVATLARIRMSIRPRAVVDHLFWTVIPFVTLISVWQAVASAGVVSRLWLPSPGTVWSAFLEVLAAGDLFRYSAVSGRRALLSARLRLPLPRCLRVLLGFSP